MFKRFYGFLTCFLIFCFIIASTCVAIAEYPDHEVKAIVSYTAGSSTDIMARTVLQFVGEKLGVPFVIQNKPGASAMIGYTELVMSEPDGYTIGNISAVTNVTMAITRKDISLDDIQPICQVADDPSCIAVRADSPFETLEDLINYAKEHPGEISFGGVAMWGAHHICMVLLEKAAGVEFNYIQFAGGSETKANILGGHVDVGGGGFTLFNQQVKEGEMRVLAIAATNRWEEFPDIPTFHDFGYDIEVGASRCFGAPKGVPMERVQLLANTIEEVLQEPEFIAQAKKVGLYPILSFRGSEDLTKFLYKLQDKLKEILPEEAYIK